MVRRSPCVQHERYVSDARAIILYVSHDTLTVHPVDGSFPSFGEHFALQHAASSKFLSSHEGLVHQNYTFGYQEVHASNTTSEDTQWQVVCCGCSGVAPRAPLDAQCRY